MWRLLFFLALWAGACKGTAPEEGGAALPAERVVLESQRAGGAAPPGKPEAWFDGEIEAAETARREGRLYAALERVLAARAENPGPGHAATLDELLAALHEEVLALPTLEGRVEAEREPIAFGEDLRVRIRLRNTGARRVRVPLVLGDRPTRFDINDPRPVDPSSRSVFVLEVARREVDVRAQVVTTTRRVYRPLPRELDLAPGAEAEMVFTIADVGNELPLDGFRVFTVGGHFRPVVLEVGGLRRWDRVPLAEGRLRSFRPNYEHLADDPVRRLGQAIEKGAPVHLLTASALVPWDRRREAVDLLVDALQGSRPMDYAMFGALHHLTDVELGRDAAAWKAWWPRVRAGYFAGVAPGEAGTPVFHGG
jgi:hypothetical protein